MDHERYIEAMRDAGLADPAADLQLSPLEGGRNNRIYAIDGAERALILKAYVADRRDRMGAEWALTSFAWSQGIRAVPEPVAKFEKLRAAVYGRLPGRRLVAGEVTREHVAQASALVSGLQLHSDSADLPQAAEACFSVDDHLAMIDGRVRRLGDSAEGAGRQFGTDALLPAWEQVSRRVRAESHDPAARESSWVSPSDFGFHNALVDERGTARFHDFEHGGWDGPAKLICDFFCQPAVPVDMRFFGEFTAGPLGETAAQALILLDAYKVKWCCIMLNEFLPAGAQRRSFALGPSDLEVRRSEQLAKARSMLDSIGST